MGGVPPGLIRFIIMSARQGRPDIKTENDIYSKKTKLRSCKDTIAAMRDCVIKPDMSHVIKWFRMDITLKWLLIKVYPASSTTGKSS